jgi:hypothetical protein
MPVQTHLFCVSPAATMQLNRRMTYFTISQYKNTVFIRLVINSNEGRCFVLLGLLWVPRGKFTYILVAFIYDSVWNISSTMNLVQSERRNIQCTIFDNVFRIYDSIFDNIYERHIFLWIFPLYSWTNSLVIYSWSIYRHKPSM